jgi:hypothetical protein
MTALPTGQEDGVRASRLPPATVAPVTIDGIRYQQMSGSTDPDIGQLGGILGAFDAGGRRLWWMKVYDNPRRPDVEGDVQDVFFQSMTVQDDGRLLIVNEDGKRFLVDVRQRTSTAAGETAKPASSPQDDVFSLDG